MKSKYVFMLVALLFAWTIVGCSPETDSTDVEVAPDTNDDEEAPASNGSAYEVIENQVIPASDLGAIPDSAIQREILSSLH